MSFARTVRPQQPLKSKRPVRLRRAVAPKREWVNTVTDLSVHKLTPAELSHRHEIHKSHNKAAAQWELKEKALKRRFKQARSPNPLDAASLSIIREVFSDQLLLQDVLARSDRAMAVVKDLFGDSPQRQTGQVSVTMAPNSNSDSYLPLFKKAEALAQLQSQTDREALNELEESREDHRDEELHCLNSSGERLIRRTNTQKMKAQQENDHLRYQGDRNYVPATRCTSGKSPDQRALNATKLVQRVRSKLSHLDDGKEETSLASQVLNVEVPSDHPGRTGGRRTGNCVSQTPELEGSSVTSLSRDQSSLDLLQTMLGQVQADLDGLSPETEAETAMSTKHQSSHSLTGFSVALVSTLGRLVHIIQQREADAKKEAEERKILQEMLKEQRWLIDALTAEMMTLREDAATLRAGLERRTTELEQKLDSVVVLISSFGLLRQHVSSHRDSEASGTTKSHGAQHHLSPSAAWPPFEDIPAHSSASSLSRLPSRSSLSSLTSQEAMLAEIGQLKRQNLLIKNRINQEKQHIPEAAGQSNSLKEQRKSASLCAGRVTPQSSVQRSVYQSDNTDRGSKIQTAESERLAEQKSAASLSPNSVEQRLLELNRQSAAARSRLLELIEQQKQTVLVDVSPSASPVPPSAFSPNIAASRQSPEEATLEPEKELRLHQRSAGSDPFCHSYAFESGSSKIQKDSRREQEGWFALSSHIG